MKIFRVWLILLFFAFGLFNGQPVLASTAADVTAKVFVSSEATTLSAPINLLAVVVSSTQIDLSWSPPEDMTGVAGYYIYRDGVRLVSTNNLAYSDQNLLPSTTYQYYLTSFDNIGRESLPTPTVTVTTNDFVTPAPVPVVETGSHLSSSLFRLTNFKIVPVKNNGRRSLVVSFDTNWPTLATLRYGLKEDTSLAIINGTGYVQHHSYSLDSLPKSLQYYINIKLIASNGYSPTLSLVYVDGRIFGDIFRPGDVSDLDLRAQGNSIILSWQNPEATTFENIYVVRSDKFYPVTRFFGLPLWQGQMTSYVDKGLEFNKNYYYGIFVCDKDKICSLGSYAVAYLESGNGLNLITATSSAQIVGRYCEQKKVFSGDKFSLSVLADKREDNPRLCLVRLTRGGKIIGLHQLLETEDGLFESSAFSITEAGIYRYNVECYDAFGSNLNKVACGEITVAGAKPLTGGALRCWISWFIILVILILIWYFLLKSKKQNKK